MILNLSPSRGKWHLYYGQLQLIFDIVARLHYNQLRQKDNWQRLNGCVFGAKHDEYFFRSSILS